MRNREDALIIEKVASTIKIKIKTEEKTTIVTCATF